MITHQEWTFVVDTNRISGCFCNEMCAFMTGILGDYPVESIEQKLFYKQMGLIEKNSDWDDLKVRSKAIDNNPFREFIQEKIDNHGFEMPAKVWFTPGWFNHGLGKTFRDGQEEEALASFRKICAEKAKTNSYQDWQQQAKEPLKKYKAYNSVAIFFGDKPTKELCKIMIDRAKLYSEKYSQNKGKITITGFRLITETTTQTEECLEFS